MKIRIAAEVAPRQPTEKKYTLEQIARAICNSHSECTEKCVGFQYCSKGKAGTIVWLQKIVEG